jgi:hypothetical protein
MLGSYVYRAAFGFFAFSQADGFFDFYIFRCIFLLDFAVQRSVGVQRFDNRRICFVLRAENKIQKTLALDDRHYDYHEHIFGIRRKFGKQRSYAAGVFADFRRTAFERNHFCRLNVFLASAV